MRSFYGCFSLGPFEPSQSITVANALRRTLLSELKGISIVSVEIAGVAHEYSTIPGVRDSVLDILLNLKEIVLKKNCKNYNGGFRPQIGYLRARGPGIIKSGDLRLPPLIQCVDPNQYIATLADDGILNLKFIIQQGGSYLKNNNLFAQKKDLDFNSLKKRYIYLKKLLSIKNGDPFSKENLSYNKSVLDTNARPREILSRGPNNFMGGGLGRPHTFYKGTPNMGDSGGASLKTRGTMSYRSTQRGPEIKIFKKNLPNNTSSQKKNWSKNMIVIKAKKQKYNLFKKNFMAFSNLSEKSFKRFLGPKFEQGLKYGEQRPKNLWGFKNFFNEFTSSYLHTEKNGQIQRNKDLRNEKPLNSAILKQKNSYNLISTESTKPYKLGTRDELRWGELRSSYWREGELGGLGGEFSGGLRRVENPWGTPWGTTSLSVENSSNDIPSKKLFSNVLHIDAVFNPINKVNYTIEVNEQKTVESVFSLSNQVEDFTKFLSCLATVKNGTPNMFYRGELGEKSNLEIQNNSSILKEKNPKLLKQILFYSIPLYLAEKSLTPKSNKGDYVGGYLMEASQNHIYLQNQNGLRNISPHTFSQTFNREGASEPSLINNESNKVNFAPISISNNDESINSEHSPIQKNLQYSYKHNKDSKHNILLEIWTNGSIHPRIAIFLAFKKLLILFLKLKEINTATRIYNSPTNFKKLKKRIKNQQNKLRPNLELIALNEKQFLGNYTNKNKETTDHLGAPNIVLGNTPLEKKDWTWGTAWGTTWGTTSLFKQKLEIIDVGTLNISLRTYILLKRNNINTVAKLIQMTEKDLLKIFIRKSIYYKEIHKSLLQIGLKLEK
uniref:DNA-directed RNA polymerase n=1 Tax=Borodinellopsis insignis TaxID=3229915 RepID=A0AB39U3U4_9CHLO